MDNYSGIVIMQSSHPQFVQLYKEMVPMMTAQSSTIFHQQSCSFHKFTGQFTLIITAGYFISKFLYNLNKQFDLDQIKTNVKFGLLKTNNTFIELNVIALEIDPWFKEKLIECNVDFHVGYVLFLEMINQEEFLKIQKYSYSQTYQGQDLITLSSPFAIQGQEMYKNFYRKAFVSQTIINHDKTKQLMMLDLISQLGQEGGSIFNQKGEYVGMILQNIQIGNYNNRYFTFAIHWQLIKSLLEKKPQNKLIPEIQSKIIDEIFSVSLFVRQGMSRCGSCTIINDEQNQHSYLITAQHVLSSPSKGEEIIVGLNNEKAYLMENCSNNVDFAIAQLETYLPQGININYLLNIQTPTIGQTVYAVGYLYSIFQQKPCISKGTIIKLIYNKFQQLIAIVTDCFIHNGYSGGGLFDQQGQLLGVISFNIGHASEGIICDLSFITPIQIFQKLFLDLAENKKITQVSRDLLQIKIEMASEIRTLSTTTALPEIGYKPKL